MTQPVLHTGSITQATFANASAGVRTYSHTVPGGLTDVGGVVLVPWVGSADRSGGFSSGGGGATWMGNAMTLVGTIAVLNSSQGQYVGVAVFAIPGGVSAATGNIVVTNSAEATLWMGVLISNWENCHSSTVSGGFASGSSATAANTPSLAVTSSSNDVAIGMAAMLDTGPSVTAGTGETAIGAVVAESAGYVDARALGVYNAGTNPTLDWVYSVGSGGVWCGFSLKGTGGGGGSSLTVERLVWMS